MAVPGKTINEPLIACFLVFGFLARPRSRYVSPRRPPSPEVLAAAAEGVRGVYAELDKRPVYRECIRRTECCQFNLTKKVPQVTRGEAMILAQGWRAKGHSEVAARPDGVCPVLDQATGNCLAYAFRPFSCRTHFCPAAGGPYRRKEVIDLIQKLEAIDATLGSDGPLALPIALAAALRRG